MLHKDDAILRKFNLIRNAILSPLQYSIRTLNKRQIFAYNFEKRLARLIKKKKKGEGPKSIRSEMKKETLQPTPQKYKG